VRFPLAYSNKERKNRIGRITTACPSLLITIFHCIFVKISALFHKGYDVREFHSNYDKDESLLGF
jgi:hypothetical protein